MNDAELAALLDAAVLAVPGVLQSYDTRPALVAAATGAAAVALRGVGLVGPGPAAGVSPVQVSQSADGVSVRVSIAVSDSRAAAETCRDAYEAVVSLLASAGLGVADLAVEVARIG